MSSCRRFVALASAAIAAGPALPVRGQANVVNRKARLVVGFPAGSSPDVVARLLAEHMKGPGRRRSRRPGSRRWISHDAQEGP